nr:endonuclease/exonuclease/phosphatase family protein [Gordonia araii]
MLGIALLVGGIAAVALFFYPSRDNVTIYPASAVPVAVLTTVAAVLLFALMRRWILMGAAVVVAGALVVTQLPLWISETPANADAQKITVLSSNLMAGEGDIGALAEIVGEVQPDIVSLQELTPEAWARAEASPITTVVPNLYAVPGPFAAGTALLTRDVQRDQAKLPDMILHNLAATTNLSGAPDTRVLSIHAGAPVPGHGTSSVNDIGVLRGHFEKLPPGRVIAVGDFNATWNHKHYRQLLHGGLIDATDQAGAGWVPTYPTDKLGRRPVVGIDHVISRGFVATSVETRYLPGADHRVLIVKLVPR